MAKLTTEKAVWRLLIGEDYLLLWLRSGFTKAYRRKCLHLLNKDELSVRIQEKILAQCGFSVVVEKQWETPSKDLLSRIRTEPYQYTGE